MNFTILPAFLFSRDYTLGLLADIPDDRWFEMPGRITHVAWQVGHLASAELRLGLIRIRGPRAIDDEIYPMSVRQFFQKDDTPRSDPSVYPSPARLREILHRVREQLFIELPTYTESQLAESLDLPHRLCKTKGDCLVWAPRHELIHAGQIGLLRRQLGLPPQW